MELPFRRSTALLPLLSLFLFLAAHIGPSHALPDDFLAPHNAARAAVGVPNLTWDPALAAYALNYSHLQRDDRNCTSMIPSQGPYGENFFSGGAGKAWTPTDAVNSWVSAKQHYNSTTNTCATGHECGTYTQVVWRASTSLGCAFTVCYDDSAFIMCSYNPAGNILGERPF